MDATMLTQNTDSEQAQVYYCPSCGYQMDVLIQPIEWATPPREIIMVTCWRQGQCQLATFTISDGTLFDFDDLRTRYHVEIKYSPVTGELL